MIFIGVHEFSCHGKGIHRDQHYRILAEQRKHSSWKKNTAAFKEFYKRLEKQNDEYKPH